MAFQPAVMVWPAGRVNVSDQPSTVVPPVFAIVMLAVSPLFHAFTAYATRQPPVEPPDDETPDDDALLDDAARDEDALDDVLDDAARDEELAVELLELRWLRPRNAMEYAIMPDCGSVCPVLEMLMPSMVAWVPLSP